MSQSTFQNAFATFFESLGVTIESVPGYPKPTMGPKILFFECFGSNRFIFSDIAFFTLSEPLSNQEFRLSINNGPTQSDVSSIPDFARRLLRIEGIEDITYENSEGFPRVTLRKSMMFLWDDIIPKARYILTHPEESLSECLSRLGASLDSLVCTLFSPIVGRKFPETHVEFWFGDKVIGDDDNRDRVYVYLSKRLLQQGHDSFDSDSKPGWLNPLPRRLLDIEGVKRVKVYPYYLIIYVDGWETWETGRPTIVRTFS